MVTLARFLAKPVLPFSFLFDTALILIRFKICATLSISRQIRPLSRAYQSLSEKPLGAPPRYDERPTHAFASLYNQRQSYNEVFPGNAFRIGAKTG